MVIVNSLVLPGPAVLAVRSQVVSAMAGLSLVMRMRMIRNIKYGNGRFFYGDADGAQFETRKLDTGKPALGGGRVPAG